MIESRKPVMQGGCACNAVRYELYSSPVDLHVCDCQTCQKVSGNFFQPYYGLSRKDFAWTKGRPGTFRSSSHAERNFCRDCGTPVTYRPCDGNQIGVMVASLDDDARQQLESEYNIDIQIVTAFGRMTLVGDPERSNAHPSRH